jgi:hypothetical protein
MGPIDAYQQIAAAVTPAVMVSACGLVALGLDNQISRMGLRLRELAREHRDEGVSSERRAGVARQVAVLDRRHGLYFRALILNYGALFAFVVTSLLWLGQAFAPVPPQLPLLVFAMGLLMVAALAVLVVAAIHLARSTIEAEADEVLGRRRHGRRGGRGEEPAHARP